MKYFLPLVCSVFLIGCGDSSQNGQPAQSDAAVETPAPSAESSAPDTAGAEAVPAAKAPVSAEPAVAAATAAAAQVSKTVDTALLYTQKCASCHGMKAEKSALGKSQVIAGWSAKEIKDSLHGYRDGTYGKEMKALMQGQAKALSDAEIDALSQYIPTL